MPAWQSPFPDRRVSHAIGFLKVTVKDRPSHDQSLSHQLYVSEFFEYSVRQEPLKSSSCSFPLWIMLLLSGIPLHLSILGPITLTLSSLPLLVKAMHCGYFWLFCSFGFFLITFLCLLWSELIDLFFQGVALVLKNAE